MITFLQHERDSLIKVFVKILTKTISNEAEISFFNFSGRFVNLYMSLHVFVIYNMKGNSLF